MKYKLDVNLWEVKDGEPTRLKLGDNVFVREDIAKKEFDKPSPKPKKEVKTSKEVYDTYIDWLKDKTFFNPYDIKKTYPKMFTMKKITKIVAKLIEKDIIRQIAKDRFQVLK